MYYNDTIKINVLTRPMSDTSAGQSIPEKQCEYMTQTEEIAFLNILKVLLNKPGVCDSVGQTYSIHTLQGLPCTEADH